MLLPFECLGYAGCGAIFREHGVGIGLLSHKINFLRDHGKKTQASRYGCLVLLKLS